MRLRKLLSGLGVAGETSSNLGVMPSRYLIYGLVDPRDGQLRYVGKSTNGLSRPKAHGRPSSLRGCTHRINWIRQLQSEGLAYLVVVLQEFDAPEILSQAEIFWIAYYRKMGAPLTNGTVGGDGGHGPCSEATKSKVSSALKGRFVSSIARSRMSAARKGCLGRPQSADTREKIRLDHMGHTVSEASKLKNSVSHGGRSIVDQYGRIYPTTREAARVLGLDQAHIVAVLKGRARSTGSYSFHYVE